jgi:hypothetical protein
MTFYNHYLLFVMDVDAVFVAAALLLLMMLLFLFMMLELFMKMLMLLLRKLTGQIIHIYNYDFLQSILTLCH